MVQTGCLKHRDAFSHSSHTAQTYITNKLTQNATTQNDKNLLIELGYSTLETAEKLNQFSKERKLISQGRFAVHFVY